MTQDLYTEILKSEPMPLTPDQLRKLIQLYAEQVVDSMDVRDLCQFAIDTLVDNMDGMSEQDVVAEITYLYDEETLNDLLESVK